MSTTPTTPTPTTTPPAPVVLECVAGYSTTIARQTPNDDGTYGGVYVGSEAITATFWTPASNVYALRQAGPPNAWLDAAGKTSWVVPLDDAQTAALGAGTFSVLVTAPLGPGRTGVLFEGQLVVDPGPGAAHA
jgi:hypothetical protein